MKRWLAAICAAVLFGMLWRVPAVCAAEEPEIPAAAYALMETETGTLLLESHSGDRLVCGAMAKLMTAYLAAEQVEQGNWTADTVLTATDAVTGTKGAVIWLTAGEEMTVGDLLKGLIVGNANDAAVVLAVAASGDAETFVMDMNARAFDLGMRDTRFTSPQGSPDDRAYTTAADLARLCCALAKQECLREYFRTWRDFLRGDATELVNENTFARTDETSIGFKACHSESEGWSIAAGQSGTGCSAWRWRWGAATRTAALPWRNSCCGKGSPGGRWYSPDFPGNFSIPSRFVAAWNVPCWQNRDGSRHWSSHGAAASWKP